MRRRSPLSRHHLGAGLAGLALLVPFSVAPTVATSVTSPAPESRHDQYAAAAEEYGVPLPVLLGVSYLQSRWDTHAGEPSTSGGFGPMHLTDADEIDGPGTEPQHDLEYDRRGDDGRDSAVTTRHGAPPPDPAALNTLDKAAGLTGLDESELRTDAGTNIRGGAALLAAHQEDLGAPTGSETDPADWYGAVARYSGADTLDAAAFFADEVYDTIRTGMERRVDDGERVVLDAHPGISPDRSWLDELDLRQPDRPDEIECPLDISCEWLPAPYELRGDGTDVGSYGNHDLGNRPEQQEIEYIVIHDAEGYFDTTVDLAQDKDWVSWNYTLRSSDGHIAQHLESENVGWHAGNWFVNAKSIGLEHEGFAADGSWYTEAMYRTSAKLVRHLAEKFDIPLDRHHIIGHDNIPGITPAYVPGMHWDPGPYWDWSHYFDLMGASPRTTGTPQTGLVTIDPDFATNQPAFTGCDERGEPCPARGSSSVILHSEPSHDAPLVTDIGLHPDGSPATMHISDHGARASAGQTFAIADHDGDWTAIWYLGQKAWFHNPPEDRAAVWSRGFVATPKPGLDEIPVYGRAYPEPEAFDEVPVQDIVPLQYTISAGERYAAGPTLQSEYYRSTTYDGSSPGDWTVVRGEMEYVQIQLGHRMMYVDRDDVDLMPAARGAPR
ncbi:N-acetylmuramoyl-L-alanine amidase [Actinobacteria bacterium YIM 96077]|uniref:N-acetylmuramoyl-L-alanine amidase n=1 Tax=Phytoactinopolyspora halophila TaxID=1981511 RepID=A0A329QHN1_9ACTN|nr:peptidoglycan recognition family protein [Phytoactinopolyspora halophila]AYY14395.1 N-acetylmuramoyl-L-alanine amidase [Actinobacteria bacterium YIM 96077]RAW11883.1 N-acetylmuramoyl-L-alanine amidase [Phytoactinopolyspora halophila]